MKQTLLTLAAAAFLATGAASSATGPGLALPFVEDDYAGAVADAKTRGVPLFVEVWAPW